jgi:hypothetical protein
VGPVLGTVSEVDISGFREIEHRDFGVRGAELYVIATRELAKDKNPELISEFWNSGFGVFVSRRSTTGFAISRSPIPRILREESHEVSLWVQISQKGNIRAVVESSSGQW